MTDSRVNVDSTLGRWTLHGWSPPPGSVLDGLLVSLWHFDGVTYDRHERTFPDGTVELIIHLDDRYRAPDGDWSSAFPVVCVAGLQTRAQVVVAPDRRCRVIGVRMHPVGAYALLGRPLTDLTGVTTDLCDALGADAFDLAEQTCDRSTPAAQLQTVADWLSVRVARSLAARRLDPAVTWVAAEIARQHGHVRIAGLRDRAGSSGTRLTAGFLSHVGLTPKRYARVMRFRRAMSLIGAPAGGRTLSEVAATVGYYDQAHMNADFREMAGMSPARVASATRYPGSVSLAESGPAPP